MRAVGSLVSRKWRGLCSLGGDVDGPEEGTPSSALVPVTFVCCMWRRWQAEVETGREEDLVVGVRRSICAGGLHADVSILGDENFDLSAR